MVTKVSRTTFNTAPRVAQAIERFMVKYDVDKTAAISSAVLLTDAMTMKYTNSQGEIVVIDPVTEKPVTIIIVVH